jgi:hypothetical protein
MISMLIMCVVTLGALGLCWLIIHELMRPIILQRVREAKCTHAFESRVHNSEGIVFETRFCPKCAAVRIIAAGEHVGVVKRPESVRQKQPLSGKGKR